MYSITNFVQLGHLDKMVSPIWFSLKYGKRDIYYVYHPLLINHTLPSVLDTEKDWW